MLRQWVSFDHVRSSFYIEGFNMSREEYLLSLILGFLPEVWHFFVTVVYMFGIAFIGCVAIGILIPFWQSIAQKKGIAVDEDRLPLELYKIVWMGAHDKDTFLLLLNGKGQILTCRRTFFKEFQRFAVTGEDTNLIFAPKNKESNQESIQEQVALKNITTG